MLENLFTNWFVFPEKKKKLSIIFRIAFLIQREFHLFRVQHLQVTLFGDSNHSLFMYSCIVRILT